LTYHNFQRHGRIHRAVSATAELVIFNIIFIAATVLLYTATNNISTTRQLL